VIDKNKQYKTRDGREVRIYATDGGGEFPVHGAIRKPGDIWESQCWGANGEWCHGVDMDCYDLIEVRPRVQREVWVNVYHDMVGTTYETKEKANRGETAGRIACVKVLIDCEEGDGL
jgi:hypothetical protein